MCRGASTAALQQRVPGPSLSQYQLSLWKLAGQILPSSQTLHTWGMASRYSFGNVDSSGSDTEQKKWKAQDTSGGTPLPA